MRNKKTVIALIGVFLLLVAGTAGGCTRRGTAEVTFDQLFADPNRYNNEEVTMEGFYFHGFEVIVLSENLEYSGYTEGHLIPRGKMIWVSGGIPKEVYDALNQQQMMGPVERYGKVRMTGKFEYGGQYGHLGAYAKQITPTRTEILSWSVPVSETPKGNGFAIYLLADDIPVSQMPIMSHFEPEEKPFLSLEDIVFYIRETHEIGLTTSAIDRVRSLGVLVSGKPFVVCVERQQIYWGAFWTPFSSLSFNGVTIGKPVSPEQNSIRLELGYPARSFFRGEDPRSDPVIMQSLEEAGKLK